MMKKALLMSVAVSLLGLMGCSELTTEEQQRVSEDPNADVSLGQNQEALTAYTGRCQVAGIGGTHYLITGVCVSMTQCIKSTTKVCATGNWYGTGAGTPCGLANQTTCSFTQ